MFIDLIKEYREIVLDPVIDAMNEEIACTNDLDKKKEIQHKIDDVMSAWDKTASEVLNGDAPDDRTRRAINNIAFESISNREYPEAGNILELLEEQFPDKD